MKGTDRIANLRRALEALDASLGWLERSYRRCRGIALGKDLAAEDFDALENLTSRFARTVDILIHKVYRAVDAVELEEGGALLDVVNRAHKRGLLDDVEAVREMKDVRNEIAHEYVNDRLEDLFADVLALTPRLIGLVGRATSYCRRYLDAEGSAEGAPIA